MAKIKITVASVGHMPADFNRQKIKNWKSSLFEVVDGIESYALTQESDGDNWEFTDAKLETVLPRAFNGDFLIALVNVPIENNWYSRRLAENRVVFTFHEMKDILNSSNIPLENLICRILYAYTLLYKRSNNRIPSVSKVTGFTHDETRGCLFDMTGIKNDVIYSCHYPIICPDCVEKLRREHVSEETITTCQKEIKKIRKILFYRIAEFIKKHPVWSLIISAITAIFLGTIGSVIASFIYETIRVL
ncbi:MAG: hypothetical protein NUW09_04960 [Deltaproteobacteria bacterium]|nr:hypothetical protein [Deltaproteobacteria bacterium]